MIMIDHAKADEYAAVLQDLSKPITDRVNSLFCLRTVGTIECVEALIKAFELEEKSDFLRHEICYCLGQMNKSPEHDSKILTFFEKILQIDYPKIVLHEAVEALGNVSREDNLKLLERFSGEKDGILYETCFLAEKLVQWRTKTNNGKLECLNLSKLKFTTNDPAPPYNFKREPKYADLTLLQDMLLDPVNYDLFERYRALFTLREFNTEEAVVAMCQCFKPENSKLCSDLLKHEVAFVIAQMEDVFSAAVPFMLDCVENSEEAAIVRHEVLICLGENLEYKDRSRLEPFLSNPELLVS
jgi:deoxyhypusine monooxygenase